MAQGNPNYKYWIKNEMSVGLTATSCRRIWGSGSRDLEESDSVTAKGTVLVRESNSRKLLREDGVGKRVKMWSGHLVKPRVVGVGDKQ